MRVLVACEFSGVVRDAFLARGHDAWSCDIVGSGHPRHLQGNAEKYLAEEWDLVIAHPPCTYLCNFGYISHTASNKNPQLRTERLMRMIDGAEFFKKCLNANAPMVCVENPVPNSKAVELIGRKYDQIIHPWQYGHPYTKATCLWLTGLPMLVPTDVVEPTERMVNSSSTYGRKKKGESTYTRYLYKKPGKKLGKGNIGSGRINSVFHEGVATAMADQWGGICDSCNLFNPNLIAEDK